MKSHKHSKDTQRTLLNNISRSKLVYISESMAGMLLSYRKYFHFYANIYLMLVKC